MLLNCTAASSLPSGFRLLLSVFVVLIFASDTTEDLGISKIRLLFQIVIQESKEVENMLIGVCPASTKHYQKLVSYGLPATLLPSQMWFTTCCSVKSRGISSWRAMGKGIKTTHPRVFHSQLRAMKAFVKITNEKTCPWGRDHCGKSVIEGQLDSIHVCRKQPLCSTSRYSSASTYSQSRNFFTVLVRTAWFRKRVCLKTIT